MRGQEWGATSDLPHLTSQVVGEQTWQAEAVPEGTVDGQEERMLA